MRQRSTFLFSALCFGFAFFYIPIISMIVFSFNKSRLATVWGGFSVEWYFKLFKNAQIIKAATLSLEIAVISATFATILGTMAGMALARFSRFRGRTLFSGLVSAPLIMPEVITGVSLLLLFVFMERYFGWPAQARLHHRHHRPHHLCALLCGGDHSIAAVVDGPVVGRSRHGSGLEALAGAV